MLTFLHTHLPRNRASVGGSDHDGESEETPCDKERPVATKKTSPLTSDETPKAPAKRAPRAASTRKAPAKTAPAKRAPKVEPTAEVVTAEVIGDESGDIRADTRRYAALSALKAGVIAEAETLGRRIMRKANALGVGSFTTEFGKVTVANRSAKIALKDEDAFVQSIRDTGAGDVLHTTETIDRTRVADVIAVLKEHAPHLLVEETFVPEYLTESFLKTLEARTVKVEKPVLDEDGNPKVLSEVNPLTGEFVDTPVTETTEEHYAVRKVVIEVPQEDGSVVEQSTEERVDFVTVTPGSQYLSYPATAEQKAAKAKAEAFFATGDLSITRAIPRTSSDSQG